ncbi:hypothetical protein K431DRAFT_192270, partial [Polychaeton citri CBS 116435]
SNSGIQKLSNGDSIIPASTRPDGTVRKEIRVRPGYKPPEDVEVYKSRTAENWRSRGKGGVPGAEALSTDKETASKAAAKNAKRREARKKTSDTERQEEGKPVKITQQSSEEAKPVDIQPVDPEAEKTKEARKLAKKLRQARELKDKKESGDNLLPEQFAKVIKINELIRQLDNLGFDAEGEKKSEAD